MPASSNMSIWAKSLAQLTMTDAFQVHIEQHISGASDGSMGRRRVMTMSSEIRLVPSFFCLAGPLAGSLPPPGCCKVARPDMRRLCCSAYMSWSAETRQNKKTKNSVFKQQESGSRALLLCRSRTRSRGETFNGIPISFIKLPLISPWTTFSWSRRLWPVRIVLCTRPGAAAPSSPRSQAKGGSHKCLLGIFSSHFSVNF